VKNFENQEKKVILSPAVFGLCIPFKNALVILYQFPLDNALTLFWLQQSQCTVNVIQTENLDNLKVIPLQGSS
jgi:hypothetical protein